MMIAALFVAKDGPYFGNPLIDPWDKERDARKYKGPYPVIAHPPCQRWGKFYAGSPLVIARTGVRKKLGDDNGCFKSALESVREYGGIIEHPWGSKAWDYFNLNKPDRKGGWIKADESGYTCCVEQGQYGHYARKPTLLYVVDTDLPELKWGKTDPVFPGWAIEKYGIDKCKRIGELGLQGGGINSKSRIYTPEPFKQLLIDMVLKT
jgi:hypothetical protein